MKPPAPRGMPRSRLLPAPERERVRGTLRAQQALDRATAPLYASEAPGIICPSGAAMEDWDMKDPAYPGSCEHMLPVIVGNAS